MKITIAPDSYKECLPSPGVARAMAAGVRRALPGAELAVVPMADGGEGTARAIVEATGGRMLSATVADPFGRPVTAEWGFCGDGCTAVVEMAQASGLERLAPAERDPMRASTRGTGQLIRQALDAGARRILIGIGGSATVDGGMGMAAALGVRFLDVRGQPIGDCCGGRLADVAAIDPASLDERIPRTEIVVASDVTNPLTGPLGAALVFGPQKGATPEQARQLDRGLASLARLIETQLGVAVDALPGAGAAGGLGAGLVAFLGARIRSGVETVIEVARLDERMQGSALVLTGEGRLDGQTVHGKTVAGVAAAAARHGIPVVALAGSLQPGYEALYGRGVVCALSIVDRPMDLAAAMADAPGLLERAAESVVRLWSAAGGGGHV
ncbi:MAG: glycerate kinase [Candidatus Brocadiaceae bacterium]|nr:glycerate kinase [Candidatus Brocadiaceae bacterium]